MVYFKIFSFKKVFNETQTGNLMRFIKKNPTDYRSNLSFAGFDHTSTIAYEVS